MAERVSEIEGFYDLKDDILRDVFRSLYDSLVHLQNRIDNLEDKITKIQDVCGED